MAPALRACCSPRNPLSPTSPARKRTTTTTTITVAAGWEAWAEWVVWEAWAGWVAWAAWEWICNSKDERRGLSPPYWTAGVNPAARHKPSTFDIEQGI